MSDNSMLVTLTKADLKQLIKDAIAESAHNAEPEVEELMSPAQARKMFNPAISKISLHRWTKDGLIPVHRLRGRIWYKRSDIITASKTIMRYDRNKLPTA